MSITLYGAALSPFVRKTRAALAIKELSYEHIQVDPARKPEDFAKLSPLERIPAFQDGDLILADSAVICQYLEKQYGGKPLYPESPYDYARVLWFEKYADYELSPHMTFSVFRNRVVMRLLRKESDETKVAASLEKHLPPLWDYLEAEIDGEFIVGNSLTVADLAIGCQVINMSHGNETIDADRWPKLSAYANNLLQQEPLAELWAQDQKLLKKIFG